MNTILSIILIVSYFVFIGLIIFLLVRYFRKRSIENRVFHSFVVDELKQIHTALNLLNYKDDE